MGIKGKKWMELSKDLVEHICNLYSVGQLTTSEIAKETDITEFMVVRTLVKKGLIRDY